MRTASNPVRVILGDDSGFIRILLSDYLRQDEAVNLVATATNGKEVVDAALKHKPDVVITDLVMPEYDGLYAVQSLMRHQPIPIVLLSSLSATDPKVFEALSAGAAEFMGKPQGQPSPTGPYAKRLLRLVKTLADGHIQRPVDLGEKQPIAPPPPVQLKATHSHELIVVGASTGGPAVLEHLIGSLPPQLPVPMVVVQHMPATFITAFARRLDQQCALTVTVAEEGEEAYPGVVYLAGGHANLRLQAPKKLGGWATFTYTHQQYQEFNNPSVDCLFESAAAVYGSKVLAVILSGMGRDGGRGMAKIRQAGGFTLAQDEQSSVVFGMANFAIGQQAVQKVAAASELSGLVIKHL